MPKHSPPKLRRTRSFWRIRKSEWRGKKYVRRWPARLRRGLASWSNTIFLQLIRDAWSKISFNASDRLHDRKQFKSEIYQGAFSIGLRGGARRKDRPKALKFSWGLYRLGVAKGLDQSRGWNRQPEENPHRSIKPAATFDFSNPFPVAFA